MEDVLSFDNVDPASLCRVWVDTRQATSGFTELDCLMERRRSQGNAFAIGLIGPPRCGKSSLIKEYLRRCRDEVAGRKGLKFLWVELFEHTKARNISTLTLLALGDPSPSKGDITERRQRVIDALKRREYDLIVYDEAHNLVDSATQSVQDDGVAFLVGLLNTAKVPIVLVGYDKEVKAAIHRNSSLAGRLWPFKPFRAYDPADGDDMLEFRFVLRSFERAMEFPTSSDLHLADTAARICYTCCGRLGLLELYLEYAMMLARRRSHSCLTRDDLRDAADAVGPNNRSNWSFNPFAVEDLGKAIETSPTVVPKVRERKRGA